MISSRLNKLIRKCGGAVLGQQRQKKTNDLISNTKTHISSTKKNKLSYYIYFKSKDNTKASLSCTERIVNMDPLILCSVGEMRQHNTRWEL